MTTKEAAARLAISQKTLRRLVAIGHLEFVNVGTESRVYRRFAVAQLEHFILTRRGKETYSCRSISLRAPPTITTTSGSTASAFTDLQNPRIGGKRQP
ncbi:helix-turn-helix domain-containing protein [Ensifer glycinis]|uniref:helix-turn-helix domain-containing protein n=1 Tax=Sinorhizobium glycinis TaxID=1472378 RepID=UPI00139069F8